MSLKRFIMAAAAPIALVCLRLAGCRTRHSLSLDTSTYVQALAQVQNTLKVIEQGKQQIETATTPAPARFRS